MKRLNINETFICKIWEGGERFYSDLQTVEGKPVKILEYGKRNFDSGPDYKNAKIIVGDKTFAGDVEIHRELKDWDLHNHTRDRRYNSVILHVALWDSPGTPAVRLRRRMLPAVILNNFLNKSVRLIWQEVIDNPHRKLKLPCSNLNHKVSDDTVGSFLQNLASKRLNLKVQRMKARLSEISEQTGEKDSNTRTGWEQVLYEYVFEALGYSKNKEPMLKLAQHLNLNKIRRVLASDSGDTAAVVRALLYGAGGMLFDMKLRNKFANKLKDIWNVYKDEIKIPVLLKSEWYFFRLRPQNFPSVRLAYGAQFIIKILNNNLLRQIMTEFDRDVFSVKSAYKNLCSLLEAEGHSDAVQVKDYLSFLDRPAKFRFVGKDRITDIIVNVFIPLAYLYSASFKKEIMQKNVITFYSSLRVRTSNTVLEIVKSQLLKNRSLKINTSAFEQGSIQLYNFYCMKERCAECKIGQKIFSENGYEYKIIFY